MKQSTRVKWYRFDRLTRWSTCKRVEEWLTLVIISLFSFCLEAPFSASAEAQDSGPFYLRYQGRIEGVSGDLPDTISCYFQFSDVFGNQIWDETIDPIPLIERHFTVTLGTQLEGGPAAEIFNDQVDLYVACDLDGTPGYEVSITEVVSMTPQSAFATRAGTAERVDGVVNAERISVQGREIVDAQGDWVGRPPLASGVVQDGIALVGDSGTWLGPVASQGDISAQTMRAGDLILSTLYHQPLEQPDLEPVVVVNGQGQVTAPVASPSGSITEFDSAQATIDQLTLGGLFSATHEVGDNPTPLIDDQGVWVGKISPFDRDGDGVYDLLEIFLGTDPDDETDAPTDRNENGVVDLFEVEEQNEIPSELTAFSSLASLVRSPEQIETDPETLDAWEAASVTFAERGALESVQVTFTLYHPVNVGDLQVTLRAPNGDLIVLLSTDGAVNLGNEVTYSFDEAQPPEGVNWFNEVITANGNERSVEGDWAIILQDQYGADLSARISDVTFEVDYRSDEMIEVIRDMSMATGQRLGGIDDPVLPDEAVNKAYVDREIAHVAEQVDLIQGYPEHFTYRSRSFETYDVGNASYLFGDRAELFGGISPSALSTQGVTASGFDQESLHALLNQEFTAGTNALISYLTLASQSDSQGLFTVLHTQVENTTDEALSWTVQFDYTCHEQGVLGPQRSSLALNGVDQWSSAGQTCGSSYSNASVELTLPAQQVSSLIFLISASDQDASNIRRVMFAFTDGSLALPDGLRYRNSW